MMDNEELSRRITTAIHEAELRLAKDLGKLEALISAHQGDPYAHRQMMAVETAKREVQEIDWTKWRTGMNNWRAYLTGAIAVVVAVAGLIAGALVQHVNVHYP